MSSYDVVIRGGTVFDGSGAASQRVDVAVSNDRIVALGDLEEDDSPILIDANGFAVVPGFINALSHSEYTLLREPTGLSELVQGVTTQIFGEGESMGPLSPAMKQGSAASASLSQAILPKDESFDAEERTWDRLGEYLDLLEANGISQNVGSLVGAATLRKYVIGDADRPAAATELDTMAHVLSEELEDGALGVGSALIYPPGSYASTNELVRLCQEASKFDAAYYSHVRGEGVTLLDAIFEVREIVHQSGVRAEILHLKAAGESNWHLMTEAVDTIQAARDDGQVMTADMYPYTASSTGLSTTIPPAYYDGGDELLYERLESPIGRREVVEAVERGWDWDWSPTTTIPVGLTDPQLQRLAGRPLAEIADHLGLSPAETVVELIRREHTRIPSIFHSMSEENLMLGLSQPWVSIVSDGSAMAPHEPWTKSPIHPRNYGSFARFLGRYVRDRKLVSFSEAIRRMTSLPARTLGLVDRGSIAIGHFADLVVMDPQQIGDRATFDDPHQLAIGVQTVIVNGTVALENGVPTSERPGRALRRGGR